MVELRIPKTMPIKCQVCKAKINKSQCITENCIDWTKSRFIFINSLQPLLTPRQPTLTDIDPSSTIKAYTTCQRTSLIPPSLAKPTKTHNWYGHYQSICNGSYCDCKKNSFLHKNPDARLHRERIPLSKLQSFLKKRKEQYERVYKFMTFIVTL